MEPLRHPVADVDETLVSIAMGAPVRTYTEMAGAFVDAAAALKAAGDSERYRRAYWDFLLCSLSTLPTIVMTAHGEVACHPTTYNLRRTPPRPRWSNSVDRSGAASWRMMTRSSQLPWTTGMRFSDHP